MAVPAGTYTFNLKYVSHSRTRATIDWVDITQNLEGGKCYKVDGREGLRKPEGTLEKLESAVRGPDWYVTFSVAETNSRSFSFPDNNSIRIWGISGSKYPRWKQIQVNTSSKAGGLECEPLKAGCLGAAYGGVQSNICIWSKRRSSASCRRMYSRIAVSSRPTVEAKYPRAQKCCPVKFLRRPPTVRAM